MPPGNTTMLEDGITILLMLAGYTTLFQCWEAIIPRLMHYSKRTIKISEV